MWFKRSETVLFFVRVCAWNYILLHSEIDFLFSVQSPKNTNNNNNTNDLMWNRIETERNLNIYLVDNFQFFCFVFAVWNVPVFGNWFVFMFECSMTVFFRIIFLLNKQNTQKKEKNCNQITRTKTNKQKIKTIDQRNRIDNRIYICVYIKHNNDNNKQPTIKS